MRAFPLALKAKVSEKLNISSFEINIDKILFLEVLLIVFLIFTKLYVRCLYISEEKRIYNLKYQIKLTQGEIGKLRTEYDKYIDRERLDSLSKAFKKEEDIEVYVVK